MSDPFIGEIIMFGGNFAPRGWALCNGTLLPISSNSALFSILGTTYGGDGRTTFGLPDLRGRYAMHPGNGPGLSQRRLGEKSGSESTTLNTNQLPAHTHTGKVRATGNGANTNDPTDNGLGLAEIYSDQAETLNLGPDSLSIDSSGGGGQSFNNVPPFQCVNFIIALVGTFPSRN
jgi:microcystin-dependent protein